MNRPTEESIEDIIAKWKKRTPAERRDLRNDTDEQRRRDIQNFLCHGKEDDDGAAIGGNAGNDPNVTGANGMVEMQRLFMKARRKDSEH